MRIIAAGLIMTLGLALRPGIACAQLPGVAAAQLEQAPKPNPAAPLYRQTGEQYRVYDFPGTGESIPYRLFVPESWKPEQRLPVLITLRAGNSINNNHRDGNQLVKLARERGYIVISPLGYRGISQPYYGSPYAVDREAGPSVPADGWTAQENQRAQLDVLYVLNLVAAEYNSDTSRVFLHGQNPSGSAAFNFAAQYPDLFRAIVVSAGPIISANYPFDRLQGKTAVLMLAGDKDAKYTAAACERMTKELQQHGVKAEFHLVPNGEHLNAYLLHAPQLFDFLDKQGK
ncbi:MAG TPA: alpha/beta hydrolase-fold protein [Steroidobacteraceae bacterium]|nr:alpha/beta hydrolase-fold protein [Steroidobacteraceae bacterium]